MEGEKWVHDMYVEQEQEPKKSWEKNDVIRHAAFLLAVCKIEWSFSIKIEEEDRDHTAEVGVGTDGQRIGVLYTVHICNVWWSVSVHILLLVWLNAIHLSLCLLCVCRLSVCLSVCLFVCLFNQH